MAEVSGVRAAGTAVAPIFIVGFSAAAKPTIANTWEVGGSYVILEHLAFDYTSGDGNLGIGGNHNAVRSCSFRDPAGSSYGAGVGIAGSFILFHDNMVYDQSNWQGGPRGPPTQGRGRLAACRFARGPSPGSGRPDHTPRAT